MNCSAAPCDVHNSALLRTVCQTLWTRCDCCGHLMLALECCGQIECVFCFYGLKIRYLYASFDAGSLSKYFRTFRRIVLPLYSLPNGYGIMLFILLLFIHFLQLGRHPVAAVVTCYISTDYEDFTVKFMYGGLHVKHVVATWNCREPTQHLLKDPGKPKKTWDEMAGHRTFRVLTVSQPSGI